MTRYDCRLRASRRHLFTWIGYERLDQDRAYMAAMVPRRVPRVTVSGPAEDGGDGSANASGEDRRDAKLEGFQLGHYAMLLNIFPFVTVDDNPNELRFDDESDYMNFLPVERLRPFERRNLFIAARQQSYAYGDKSSYRSIRSLVDTMARPRAVFVNSGSAALHCYPWLMDPAKASARKSLYRLGLHFKYRLYCPEEYNRENHIWFPFEEHSCYDRDPDTGLWRFNQLKATPEVFSAWCVDSMPDAYVASAREAFEGGYDDILLLQNAPKFQPLAEERSGWVHHAAAMKAQQRFEQRHRLGKILQMLPIIKMQLNSGQTRILNSLENLFILGRSGTGKTTTTVLRAFCQEVVFLAVVKQERLLNYYSGLGLAKKWREAKRRLPRLTASDVEGAQGVKMVFVTASPVLTNEVKQYYASLRQQLAAHLLVVEKNKQGSADGEGAAQPDSGAPEEEKKDADA